MRSCRQSGDEARCAGAMYVTKNAVDEAVVMKKRAVEQRGPRRLFPKIEPGDSSGEHLIPASAGTLGHYFQFISLSATHHSTLSTRDVWERSFAKQAACDLFPAYKGEVYGYILKGEPSIRRRARPKNLGPLRAALYQHTSPNGADNRFAYSFLVIFSACSGDRKARVVMADTLCDSLTLLISTSAT